MVSPKLTTCEFASNPPLFSKICHLFLKSATFLHKSAGFSDTHRSWPQSRNWGVGGGWLGHRSGTHYSRDSLFKGRIIQEFLVGDTSTMHNCCSAQITASVAQWLWKNLKSKILCQTPFNVFILKICLQNCRLEMVTTIYFVISFFWQWHVPCSVVDSHWFHCGSGSRELNQWSSMRILIRIRILVRLLSLKNLNFYI